MSNQTHIDGDLVQGDKVDGDKVLGDKHEHHYQPPEFPLDNLPPPNPNFVGRLERLAAIQKAFQNPQNPVAITQTIAGLGGVGKTQLALAYAHDQRDAYDLIWLLRADDPATLDGDLRQLGAALRLPVQNVDAPTARQMVLSWLNGRHKRWLLLYDNVDAIRPGDLRPYLPGGAGHVLITTRQTRWPRAQMVRLDVFTVEEAAAFWRRRLAQRFVKSGRFDKSLAAELGYLPLALEQAAAYMAARQKSAADYLRLYRQRRQELWARAEAPDDYHATVTTTWQMAFEHARQAPGAADLLNLCCFLAPDDIPLDVITAYADTLPEELATVLADELARDDALTALTAYSLAAREDGLLTMHRLVQTVARDQMGEERAKVWAEAAVDLLAQAYNLDPHDHDMETWEAAGELIPHMRAAVALAARQGVMTRRTAYLNNAIGYNLDQYGLLEEARPYYEQALAIYKKVLGPEHPDTAQSLNNMGGLLQAMGQLAEARPYYEQALAIRQKVLGPKHPNTAQSLNNMGGLLQAMGQLAEARPYYEQSLAISQNVLGPDHPNTAQSLNNMGFLLQAMGQLAEARPYYEQALAIYKKVLGPKHPGTASSLNNMGGLLQAMGQLAEARPYTEQALAIRQKVLGPEHPDTAQSLNNMGVLLDSMGRLEEARPYYEQALAIWQKVLGPEHPDTAQSLNNMGYLLQAMGRLEEARPYYEQALAIRQKVLGPDHPDTASSLNNMGYLLQAMGRLEEARPYYEQALAIRQKVLGPDHPDTAISIWWIGVLAQEDGDVETARDCYQRALDIFTAKLGSDHPLTKSVRSYLQSL